jgi:hypothetical protein
MTGYAVCGSDLRENRLRRFLAAAAKRAGTALDELGADRGNPVDPIVRGLDDAWRAGASSARDMYFQDVRGVGQTVRDGFGRTCDDLSALVAHAAPMIDVAARPDLEWQTTDYGVRSHSGGYATYGGL